MKECYRITGLMSGSSMDGVDLACCDLEWNGKKWVYKIIEAETFPYPPELLSKLEQACNWSREQIRELDLKLGKHYAELLNSFHKRLDRLPDFISSHGHTILHEPEKGITLQVGNGKIMAELSSITVINDFRSEDVAQGGQGAPLVPVGDRLLFASYDACVNLGGFANLSCDNREGIRIAYDLSIANMALNWVAGLEGLEYDGEGAMARRGQIITELYKKLNSLDYYRIAGPKSLGREWFLQVFLPLLEPFRKHADELMATVAEHIAFQVAKGINESGAGLVLLTGGGALNQNLVERLSYHSLAEIVIPDRQLIDYKEALVFALLGLLRIRNEINCLASVTGGKRDLSTGHIHQAKNK